MAICGIFLLLVSTGILSATDSVVKAQSTGGVNGQGSPSLNLRCPPNPSILLLESLSFSATGFDGAISSGEFSLVFTTGQIWSGSLMGGTFSTAFYELTGQILESDLELFPGCPIPSVGQTVTISGNCGDNVPIQFSMSNGRAIATFTGNVQCIVPPPIPTPPPDSACVGTGSGNSVITGTPGPDTIIGTNGDNLMDGLAGKDGMNGCSGSDRMNGGADNDGMTGSEGNDIMHGTDGNDKIQVSTGNDNLFGDAGTNTLTGGPGRNSFFCSPNSETTITDFEPGVDRISGPCILAP